MRFLLFALAIAVSSFLTAQEVILTGVIDGSLSGGHPRGAELYVNGTVDLSTITFNRYANGSTSATNTVQLSGTFTDAFVYVIRSEAEFVSVFGSSGDFANVIVVNDAAQGTGDDVYTIEAVTGGAILDQAGGVIGIASNIYQDSYLYRNDNTGPDGDWVPANWDIPGNNQLDGENAAGIAALVPFGTYSTTPPGPSVSAAANGNLAEPMTNGGFTINLSTAPANSVTVTYSLGGNATLGTDYTDAGNGTVTIPANQTSVDVTLVTIDDADAEPTESIELTITGINDANYTIGSGASISLLDDEPVGVVLIHTIQGSGNASPLVGQTVSVTGIVVGDFQGGSGVGLGGFFVQEEDADADADAQTSEGIWVFDNTGTLDVAAGDRVTVTGEVQENNDLTQLNVTVAGGSVAVTSQNNALPTAAALDLPVASDQDYESIEGMLTTVVDAVSITQVFNLGRFGEFEVSEGERLIQFTECNESDPAGLGPYNDSQSARRLTVDDGRSGQNVFPIVILDDQEVNATNSFRSGQVLTGLTGVMDERFTGYRLQGLDATSDGGNARPASAPAVGGELTVVGMNVLNYFTTLGSRGANNAAEFERQEDKIVAAICELDADILGLVEIENDGSGAGSTIQALVDAIAASRGIQYEIVNAPTPGTDEIYVALIYKDGIVEESGTSVNLNTPANVFSRNRPPLAQTFKVIEAGHPNFGQEVTVCVNHWKSKGGSCGAGDDDNGGAGSCNGSRTAAAQAISAWLATNPTGVNEPDQLIIGDLNAYSQEEPLLTLEAANWVNTVRASSAAGSFPCGSTPSYVFFGEWGSLDHAFATSSLAGKVTGAAPWQVNAPEPIALDYNLENNDPALYDDDFYRFSDHDPIVVGLDLGAALPVELSSFTGRVENMEVVLDWATSSEDQVNRFEIERRGTDGDFTRIGEVAATGSSTTTQSYTFTDTEPFNGRNDYRLRIVDNDGSEEFSDILTFDVERPNSVASAWVMERTFRLSNAPLGSRYLLTNAAGAIIEQGKVSTITTDVDGAELPAGIYFLLLRERGGRGTAFKLVLP